MNRVWIGIASDLSQDQVLGEPYRVAAAAAQRAPAHAALPVAAVPGQGRLRSIGALAVALALAVWLLVTRSSAPPERSDTTAPALSATPAASPRSSASAPAQANDILTPAVRRARPRIGTVQASSQAVPALNSPTATARAGDT